ncbi:MAG: arginine--tRNA ligase [Rubricoccaceae bacterium]
MDAYLADRFRAALAALDGLPEGFDPAAVTPEFEAPRDASHGDRATNLALQLARPLGRPPRAIAEALVAALELDPARVASVEVAGPGFINVRYAAAYLAAGLAEALAAGDTFGRTHAGAGKTAIVEYVSANPTGPLTVGHGRNAVLGDTFANLLAWTGYDVTREYYFNDAGRQMRVLGESVRARYTAIARPETPTRMLGEGDEAVEVPEGFPDDGYLGGYIQDIAQNLYDLHGEALLEADVAPFQQAAQTAIFADIEATMARLGIRMDSHFNERTLYDSGAVWDVVERLKAAGLAYEREGAVWFRTSALGKTVTDREGETQGKDVVLVKSSGEPTYRLPDIAYHMDKLTRPLDNGREGFDRVVDVFGADHIATYPDVLRGVEALGGDVARIEVVIYQFVTLVRGGEPVKMSTRKANYVTLDELMDEVGADVTRFFFLMLSPNTHLNFDLDLAREASEKNPVFYLQYAHARIASILRKAAETGLVPGDAPDLALLAHPAEQALAKTLLAFPAEVAAAADGMAPHRLAAYLRDAATAFSAFYRDCRIIGEAPALAEARLALARLTQTVLANGLAVLGISAPDRM